MTINSSESRRTLPTSPFAKAMAPVNTVMGPSFEVGDRVTHDKCGLGRVVRVDSHFVTVQFGGGELARVPQGAKGLVRL